MKKLLFLLLIYGTANAQLNSPQSFQYAIGTFPKDDTAYKSYHDSTGSYKIEFIYNPTVCMQPLTYPAGQNHYFARIIVYKVSRKHLTQIGKEFSGYYTVNGCFEDNGEALVKQAYELQKESINTLRRIHLCGDTTSMLKPYIRAEKSDTIVLNNSQIPIWTQIDTSVISRSGTIRFQTANNDTIKAVIEILHSEKKYNCALTSDGKLITNTYDTIFSTFVNGYVVESLFVISTFVTTGTIIDNGNSKDNNTYLYADKKTVIDKKNVFVYKAKEW